MLRKLWILTMFIASVTACASVTPTPLVTETPQTRTETRVGQLLATGTAPAITPTLSPTAMGDLKLTILYDNTASDPRLKSDWGFAALVEYGDRTLLFDTGANGSILLDNMRQLGVDPRSIEAVIISHEHSDHTGGLNALLGTGIRPTVYVPSTFSPLFKSQVGAQTKLVEVTDALEILPGVHTTRPVGSIVEQALVVETRDGTVVITGCAHPGVVEMVRQAQEVVPGKIALLAGGFHLLNMSKSQVQPIIAELRQLGVGKVLPTHCTGDAAIALFRAEYGENYIEGGVGRTVTSSAKQLNRGEGSLHQLLAVIKRSEAGRNTLSRVYYTVSKRQCAALLGKGHSGAGVDEEWEFPGAVEHGQELILLRLSQVVGHGGHSGCA